jgi:hypothetical protein
MGNLSTYLFQDNYLIFIKTLGHMKRISLLAICMFLLRISYSQNVGIGTTTPVQTLDVNGAVKVGPSSNNQPGSIRYNSGTFEGGNGTTWKNLEGVPSHGIIISQSADTAAIKAEGYTVLRQLDIWDTTSVSVPTNYPGSWTSGFPIGSPGATPVNVSSSESVIYNNHFIYFGTDAYLYDYDITGQKWTKLPNICPLGIRYSCGVTLVGNDIYITGGWYFSSGFIVYATSAKYSLITNTWTAIASIPVTNAYHATTAIGTDIYLLDGANSYSSGFVFNKKMYKYSTVSNTWSADLAVAATPDYQQTGSIVAWNNKIVWHTGTLKIYAYDPVANTNTDLTPSSSPTPWYFQSYILTVNTAANKLYIGGSITDTTGIDPTPGVYMPVNYSVDLTNGNIVKLSVCQLQANYPGLYKFNPGNGLIYAMAYPTLPYIFDPSGSSSCNIILKRKGYWSYMRKN